LRWVVFRKKDRAMHMVIDPKAKYKLKWNVPLNDVDIVEYGPGVNILTNSYRTTISHSREGKMVLMRAIRDESAQSCCW